MKTTVFAVGLLAVSATVPGCGSRPGRNSPTRPTTITQSTGTAELTAALNGGEPAEALPAVSSRPVTTDWHGLAAFPPRNEPNAFFNDLQALYRDTLGRPQSTTFVDSEGVNVWLTEYFRFYLNGCSHEDSVARTTSEILNGGSQPTCGAERSDFPPRDLPNDFYNRLVGTYRDVLRRSTTATFVDGEGANVWLAQYLRFRLSGCDHITGESKVFTEIRGGGVQPACNSTAPTPTPPPTPMCGVGGGPEVANGTYSLSATSDSGCPGSFVNAFAGTLDLTVSTSTTRSGTVRVVEPGQDPRVYGIIGCRSGENTITANSAGQQLVVVGGQQYLASINVTVTRTAGTAASYTATETFVRQGTSPCTHRNTLNGSKP